MAQEFLNQLLRIENTVQVDGLEAPTCMICLESYGTLNPSTGVTEVSVRLPCGHLVGSVCIARWLRDNNSCPACRKTFFPAQPQLRLEHDIMHERASRSTRRMGNRDPTDPVEICDWLCEELILEDELRNMAQAMTDPLRRQLHVQNPECNAAVCVFIAWHLLRPDETVATFLADLSHTIQLGEDEIRSTYRRIYPNRMELIVPEVLPGLAEYNTEGMLAFLPRPSVSNHITHRDDDHNTANSAGTDDREVEDLDDLRPQLTEALGDVVLSGVIVDLAEEILDILDDRLELVDRSGQLRGAVCVFTACHFLGVEMAYGDIASIHSVSEQGLRECYAHVWCRRYGVIRHRLAETMGTGNLERVLGALPALNWPSL